MSKKNYITLKKHKCFYKLYAEDIMEVHKAISKKRPRVPVYELPTQDEL